MAVYVFICYYYSLLVEFIIGKLAEVGVGVWIGAGTSVKARVWDRKVFKVEMGLLLIKISPTSLFLLIEKELWQKLWQMRVPTIWLAE